MFFCTSCPLSGCFCPIALIKIQRQQRFQKNMRKKQFFFNKGLFFFSNCVIIYGTSICGCVNERELSKIFVYSALDYRNPQKRGMVGIAQLVRASGCGPEGRGFESHYSPHVGMDYAPFKIPSRMTGDFSYPVILPFLQKVTLYFRCSPAVSFSPHDPSACTQLFAGCACGAWHLFCPR